MTNSEAFFEAFVNTEHKVLRKLLKPLSLLHLLYLYQIESPLVNTDKETRLKDLEIAVLICSQNSHSAILKALKSKGGFLWRRANLFSDFKSELTKFVHYIDDYSALPRMLPEEDKESDEKIPWLLMHAVSLIRATGWTEEAVFSLPIGKIIWFNAANSYLETGKTRIYSDKEAAAVEALKSYV